MPTSVTLVLTDRSVVDHAQATIEALTYRLAEEEVQAERDSYSGPGTWTFWFQGDEPESAVIERLLDEIDAGWRDYLDVRFGG